ncbi:MAG: flavodoxin family protein [Methanobacteriota archaeon]|nr:MAG: flavodoxin family protein [Euryarchaeota archaeon]
MPSVSIVVESKYGNTAKVAEAVAKGLTDSGISEVVVNGIREIDAEEVARADVILIGSPNHVGGPTRTVKKLIRAISKRDLSRKSVAFFDTYLNKDFGKAVGKMEAEMASRNPKANLITPGLSLRVTSMKGPLAEGELDKGVEFGRAISVRTRS